MKRNFGLDVLRTISIMLVLLAHIFGINSIELGVWGVEIFFVLSGFLIGQIVIREFTDGITIKKILNFWKRRWYRTLPLYYAVILVKFFFFDSSLGYKILVYIFFLQNNLVGISFLPVSWSLVIEEWFYLILPIILYVFFKTKIEKKSLLYFLLLSLLLILSMRSLWVGYTDRPFDAIRGNFIFRFDTLLIGVLLAHIKMNYKLFYTKLTQSAIFILGLAFMLYDIRFRRDSWSLL